MNTSPTEDAMFNMMFKRYIKNIEGPFEHLPSMCLDNGTDFRIFLGWIENDIIRKSKWSEFNESIGVIKNDGDICLDH